MPPKNKLVIRILLIAFLITISPKVWAIDEEILFLLGITSNFHYNPAGKPDPFVPFYLPESQPKQSRGVQSPLEGFPVSQFRLTAIVFSQGEALGMIEDPTGRGYVVRKGTVVGIERARVSEVTPNSLIMEIKTKAWGREIVKKIELRLKIGGEDSNG
ncbi:pilus assembly protein PilP [Thermosulfuriphilus sp.]